MLAHANNNQPVTRNDIPPDRMSTDELIAASKAARRAARSNVADAERLVGEMEQILAK